MKGGDIRVGGSGLKEGHVVRHVEKTLIRGDGEKFRLGLSRSYNFGPKLCVKRRASAGRRPKK